MDWQAGQQRRGICGVDGSAAVRAGFESATAACLFRLAGGREADDRGIPVPEHSALLAALDLPETGALAGIFPFACSARKECRGEYPGPVRGAVAVAVGNSKPSPLPYISFLASCAHSGPGANDLAAHPCKLRKGGCTHRDLGHVFWVSEGWENRDGCRGFLDLGQ